MAERLNAGQKTVYTMVQQRVLPAFRVRGQWRFRRADIESWVSRQLDGTGGGTREAAPDVGAQSVDEQGEKSGGS